MSLINTETLRYIEVQQAGGETATGKTSDDNIFECGGIIEYDDSIFECGGVIEYDDAKTCI